MDREAWWATVHSITESDSTEVTLHACVHHEFLKTVFTFPHSSVGKESACSAGDPGSIPTQGLNLGREDLLGKEMATHSGILAWKIPSQRSLVGCNSWHCKESGTTERLTLQ